MVCSKDSDRTDMEGDPPSRRWQRLQQKERPGPVGPNKTPRMFPIKIPVAPLSAVTQNPSATMASMATLRKVLDPAP